MRTISRIAALIVAAAIGRLTWRRRDQLAAAVARLRAGDDEQPTPVSAREGAVDHERQPGVPPPANDDYEDDRDVIGASSFPASDPPATW